MKVLHMIPQLRLGAGRYVVAAAIFQAQRLGYEVALAVSPDATGNWKSDPKMVAELAAVKIPVSCAGDFFHRDLKSLLIASFMLRKAFPDAPAGFVVHAHSAIAAVVARWGGARHVVATCHGFGPSRPKEYDLQDAIALRSCDVVTTPSDYWAEKLRIEYGLERPLVVPVGIDGERYPLLKRRERREGDGFRIVTVCELTSRKGVDLLIASMPRIWKHDPLAELHIVGHGDEAGLLRQQADALGSRASRIYFHGHVSDPQSLLANCDLFTLASRSDNLPVSLIEAMLAGLPIVATEVGGIPEMILGAGCGTIAKPESESGLATAIIELMRMEAGLLESMGKKGRQFAQNRYAIERTMAELDAVYRSVIRSSKWSSVDAGAQGSAGHE